MKNLADIRSRCSLEVTHWRNRHRGEPLTRGYLWYIETTHERDGGIMAASNSPGIGYCPVDGAGFTTDVNVAEYVRVLELKGILRSLPVLSLVNDRQLKQTACPGAGLGFRAG